MIPFIDLHRQHQTLKTEIDEAISRVIGRSSFTLGSEVEAFEAAFAQYCGVKYAVGVGSGTDALFMTLKAVGINRDDEVILPANTFIATAEAISMCGAVPVFVDIDKTSYNIDSALIEEKITPKTRAIIPVHLYGQPADMDLVMTLVRQYNLHVIEDACQAHGARYKGARVGSIGDAGCFSFYPSKNLGALGDGGMVVTNNNAFAEKVRLLRNHGEVSKYNHAVKGRCSRLHGLQAAVLNVKLKHLDRWNSKRQANGLLYNNFISNVEEIVTPKLLSDRDHVFHLYVIRTAQRNEMIKALNKVGIATGIHYTVPIHLTEAYRDFSYKVGDFPVSEYLAGEILSLPMFPELTADEVKVVSMRVRDVVSKLTMTDVQSDNRH